MVVMGAPVAATRAGPARHFVLLALITPLVLPRFSGWVPGYGARGEPTVWYYSRGC
jgi:hypothetical protein